MYMWPGCYSFKEELALFAQWLKQDLRIRQDVERIVDIYCQPQ